MSRDLNTIFKEIYQQEGHLTPKLVIAAARSDHYPELKTHFEWDDSVAAEQYRLQQAARLIRTVKARYESTDGASKSTRAWVATYADPEKVEEDTPSGYLPIEQVAQDPVTRNLVLRQAEREWRSLLRRYEHLEEFIELVRKDITE